MRIILIMIIGLMMSNCSNSSYVKNKKFFNKLISVSRPNFLINNFFDKNEISYENYDLSDNHKYHYLSLYLNLLKNLNIKIFSRDHYLPFKNPINQSNFNESYFLFHIEICFQQHLHFLLHCLLFARHLFVTPHKHYFQAQL